jgi:hypothetical protein
MRIKTWFSIPISIYCILMAILAFSGCSVGFGSLASSQNDSSGNGSVANSGNGNSGSGAPEIEIALLREEGLTISWDIDDAEGLVNNFELAYKSASDTGSDWIALASNLTRTTKEYGLTGSSLPTGDWVIGVLAIDGSGLTSEWHTSLDQSADPTTGWILRKE